MENITYPIQGSCQCGSVSYQLLAPPLKVVACHCTECQKLSTSAFSLTAFVDADAVEFTGDMQQWQRTAPNGNLVVGKFCATCGNRIYHVNPSAPEQLKLKASNLSDTRLIKPTVHIWTSEKQQWFTLPEDVLVFEQQP